MLTDIDFEMISIDFKQSARTSDSQILEFKMTYPTTNKPESYLAIKKLYRQRVR